MDIAMVFIIIILGGWLFSRIFSRLKLPSIVGMLFCGVMISILIKDYLPDVVWEISPLIRTTALLVILLRAGLSINKQLLKQTGKTAFLMSVIPCLMEGIALTVFIHLLFSYSLLISAVPAFLISAVSPAVIIPSMLNLKEKGYGKAREVPTIVLAASSVDDVFAITIFSLIISLISTSHFSLNKAILSIPYSIVTGILLGLLIGILLIKFFKHYNKKIRATEKTIILISISMLIVVLGEKINAAALLGAMTIGFILFEKMYDTAVQISSKLAKIWIPAEIFLFVLVGMSVDINIVFKVGFKGLLVLILGLIFRSAGVLIATSSSKLTFKERLFCVIAFLPKATVQAALGIVPLQMGISHGEEILALSVLAILFTAPLGLILMNSLSKKLLSV